MDTIVIPAGSVEYSIDEARIEIDDLISALESAKSDGAEFVVMASGNYRGAQWMRVSADLDFADDE